MKKIVIAGGTHCGKTTLIEHYRDAGYPVVAEAAIPIMTRLKDEMGLEEYRAWRKTNAQEFFEMIEDAQIANEAAASTDADFLFLDRGIQDTIVMERYVGVVPTERALRHAKENRYDLVLICDTLPEFDGRGDTGRTFTHEDSLKLTELAHQQYLADGYEPIRIPPVSLEERIALINKVLSR